jgi:hypothetical protein
MIRLLRAASRTFTVRVPLGRHLLRGLHWATKPSSSPRARARWLAAARTMIRADGAELNARTNSTTCTPAT